MEVIGEKNLNRNQTRNFLRFGFVLFFSLIIAVVFRFSLATATAIPNIVAYQGKLLNGGVSVTTTQSIQYVLYDSLSGGLALYSASGTTSTPAAVSTTVSDGFFTINLGDTDAGLNTLGSVFAENGTVYLEVTINGELLNPRKQITAVPYAINSAYLNGVAATSTAQSSQYIPMSDSGGNFQFNSITTTQLNATNFNVTNATFTNVTTTNSFWSNLITAVTGVFTNLTWTDATSTGNTVLNNLTASGNSIFATTTISNLLSVTGNATFGTISSGTWAGNVISAAYGGTGQDSSAWDGFIKVNSGVWTTTSSISLETDVTGTLPLANGGTGTSTFANGGIIFSDGTKLTQDVNNLFWDNASSSLGVGTSSPQSRLHVYDGTLLVDSPVNPTLVGSSIAASGWDVFVSNKYAYVVGLFGIKIIDISNKTSPIIVGSVNTGNGNSIYISGNYAYVNNSDLDEMKIVDVSNSASPAVVGSWSASNDIGGIYISGKYAYVADGAAGLKIIDISNPILPLEIGVFNTDGVAKNVYVSGKYAYVADGSSGISIIDVSNPTSPSLMSSLDISGGTDNVVKIYISGKYAYVANSSNGMSIVDISNPSVPDLISTIAGNFSGVNISGKYAYLPSINNIKIVDISSSDSIVLVGSLDITDTAQLFIAGKYAYVVGGAEGLKIVDIKGADISAANIGNISTNALTVWENVDIGNNLNIRNGLNVGAGGILSNGPIAINVSSTSATDTIFSVGTHTTSSILAVTGNGTVTIDNLVVTGNFSFSTTTLTITSGTWSGDPIGVAYGGTGQDSSLWSGFPKITSGVWSVTSSIDLNSDVSGILSVSNGGTGASTTLLNGSIVFSDGTQFSQNNGNLFWDNTNKRLGVGTSSPQSRLHLYGGTLLVDNPVNPTLSGYASSSDYLLTPASVYISNHYAYVAGAAGLAIVDIGNKSNPTTTGFIGSPATTTLNNSIDVVLSGKYAFVLNSASNSIAVVDVGNPSSPIIVSNLIDNTNLSSPYSFKLVGKYLYVANVSGNSLSIFDVSNPLNIVFVRRLNDVVNLNGAEAIEVSGQYAYVASVSGQSLTAVDIKDPKNPVITDMVSNATMNGAGGLYVSGRYAYVTGLYNHSVTVVDISNVNNLSVVGSITDATNLNSPSDIYVSGKYAYVVGATNKISILDISSTTPVIVGSYSGSAIGSPIKVLVVGKYAYVVGADSNTLAIIDINGADISTADIGNVASNDLTISENLEVGNNVFIRNSLDVGNGGILASGPVSVSLYGPSSTSTLFGVYSDFSTTPLFTILDKGTVAINTSTFNTLSSYKLIVDAGGSSNAGIGVNGFIQASGYITGTTTLDLAETYPINLNCEKDNTCPAPGDVVCVDPSIVAGVKKCSINDIPIGIVSTNPGFLLGGGILSNPNSNPGTVKVALSGRVPVKVKGIISPGDKLTISQVSGVAIKATSNQPTIGIAMENFPNNLTTSTVGTVVGFVNLGSGKELNIISNASGQLVYGSDLDLQGNKLINVSGILGMNGRWSIDELGHFITTLNTTAGDQPMYSIQSPISEFIFSGSSQLVAGENNIIFDQSIKDIIDFNQQFKINVSLTSGEAKGVYVSEKNDQGFVVKELDSGNSSATFDWVLVAKRKEDLNGMIFDNLSSASLLSPISSVVSADANSNNAVMASSSPSSIEVSNVSTDMPTTSSIGSSSVSQIISETQPPQPLSQDIIQTPATIDPEPTPASAVSTLSVVQSENITADVVVPTASPTVSPDPTPAPVSASENSTPSTDAPSL